MKFFLPNSKFQIPNSNEGQLLVEAIISIGIIVTGLVGILTLLANSLGLNKVVSDQYVAVYLASEGIEVMRSIVDANINTNIQQGEGTVAWNKEVTKCLGVGCVINYDDAAIAIPQNLAIPTHNPVRFDGTFYSHKDLNQPKTPFSRTVKTFIIDPDILEVQSEVTWTGRGGGNFNVLLVDRFYNR